jgi:hypothetical protein
MAITLQYTFYQDKKNKYWLTKCKATEDAQVSSEVATEIVEIPALV